jgi:hypothetical protein
MHARGVGVSSYRGTCEFCDKPVFGFQTAAHRIRGWEVERGQGGANRILARERQPNRIVHADCVERAVKLARDGLTGQGSLL